MSPVSACPRCQTHVSYELGTTPRCHACGYPGPDTRAAEPPAWGAAESASDAWDAPQNVWTENRATEPQNSGKAVAALILGITSFFFLGILCAIPAIILGSMARKEIRESNGQIAGKGMADWGFWLGIVNVIGTVLAILIYLVLAVVVFSNGA